jgi:hypothetical protein
MGGNRLIEIDGEFIWEFPDLADSEREYFRLLQLGPWSDADAKRLAELQPLEDAYDAQWEILHTERCRHPNGTASQALAKLEEHDPPRWNEWLALDSKWRRKTAEGRAAADQEWETLRRTNFSLPRAREALPADADSARCEGPYLAREAGRD